MSTLRYTPGPIVRAQDEILTRYTTEELRRISQVLNTQFEGWDDITADLSSGKVAGANVPTWATFRDGISAYRFDAGTMNEIWITFHIKHDFKWGSKLFPHVHWSPNTTTATGYVRWGFEYSLAKGHDQEAFPATTSATVDYTFSTNKQYQHIITEVTEGQAFEAYEPDSLVLMRLYRDAANDTFADPVFAFTADVHFETERAVTDFRSPPFQK